jgi:ketosteroid isomerase-like protein
MSNLATVQAIYEAFSRGDVPAILDKLAPDVAWDAWPDGNGAQAAGVPWMVERHGPEEVGEFFASAAALDIASFAPLAIIAGDEHVAAQIEIDATVRATGASVRNVEVHWWTFDDSGRVSVFRHHIDTALHAAAFAGAPVPG